jgi:hypothetical protein
MLIVEGVNGDNEFIFSNKWYDLTRWIHCLLLL